MSADGHSFPSTCAAPPGRRSIVARSPNQAPRPSAVVSAAHTLAGGRAISTVRLMRSGNAMRISQRVATLELQPYRNSEVATTVLQAHRVRGPLLLTLP